MFVLSVMLSLNPYCSGRWSRTGEKVTLTDEVGSLNPYCSGRWSRTHAHLFKSRKYLCLNPYCSGRWSRTAVINRVELSVVDVLILIVVEDGLVQTKQNTNKNKRFCLNPYCSGRWSRTVDTILIRFKDEKS